MLLEGFTEVLLKQAARAAMPKAQRIAEKISTIVDQRTFTDIMKIVQKPIETQR